MQVLRVEAMKYKHGWKKRKHRYLHLKPGDLTKFEYLKGCTLLLHAVLSVSAHTKPPQSRWKWDF